MCLCSQVRPATGEGPGVDNSQACSPTTDASATWAQWRGCRQSWTSRSMPTPCCSAFPICGQDFDPGSVARDCCHRTHSTARSPLVLDLIRDRCLLADTASLSPPVPGWAHHPLQEIPGRDRRILIQAAAGAAALHSSPVESRSPTCSRIDRRWRRVVGAMSVPTTTVPNRSPVLSEYSRPLFAALVLLAVGLLPAMATWARARAFNAVLAAVWRQRRAGIPGESAATDETPPSYRVYPDGGDHA